ncbi:MAG: hypothetical protein V3V35_07040 [Dehalococcoidia bacterium]
MNAAEIGRAINVTVQRFAAGALLLAVVAGGVLVLHIVWNQLLKPGDFASLSLPVVALAAGAASTFNPCALPALPGFLTFLGDTSGEAGVRRRAGLSLATSLGAMSVILALGVLVAIVGGQTKDLIAPNFRWVQLAVGVILIGVAALHMVGQAGRFPLVGPITSLGSRMWQGALGKPTPRGSYLFGAGFVVVGAG